MKLFKNNKKADPNETVEKLIVGVFEVRLSNAKVEVETKDKSWKMVFAHPTYPYVTIVSMAAKNQQTDLYNLIYALYSVNLFFYEPWFINEWISRSNEVSAEMQKKRESKVAIDKDGGDEDGYKKSKL
jgi:hypothetical protein